MWATQDLNVTHCVGVSHLHGYAKDLPKQKLCALLYLHTDSFIICEVELNGPVVSSLATACVPFLIIKYNYILFLKALQMQCLVYIIHIKPLHS